MSVANVKNRVQPMDEDLQVIDAVHDYDFQDGTGTAQVSPLTVSSTIKTIVIPTDAVYVVFMAIGADARLGRTSSALDGTDGEGYDLLLNGQRDVYDCSDGNSIMALRDDLTDLKLYYRFGMLD